MRSYNAIAELDVVPSASVADRLATQLGEFHPAVSATDRSTTELIFTVVAESLAQASRLAHALVVDARSMDILSSADFDTRNGVEPLEDLMSVSEVAEALGLTRPGVLDRIGRGTLPATKVGATFVIPRAAVRGR